MKKLMILMLMIFSTIALSAQESLSYGQTVTGTITDETPEVYYTFQGTEGDQVAIEMRAIEPGLDSYLRLLTPDGTEYATDDDSAGNFNALLAPVFLPVDGTYTIVATRCCGGQGSSVGTFELTIDEIDVPPIGLDQPVSFDIAADDSAAFFLLNSSNVPSNAVAVTANRTAGTDQFQLDVRGPVGEQFYGYAPNPEAGEAFLRPLILLPNGTYLFAVRRAPNYAPPGASVEAPQPLTVEVVVNALTATPLNLGETLSGQLSDENSFLLYTFEAASGDLLRLEGMTGGSIGFEAVLYNPFGYIFGSGSTFYSQSGTDFVVDPIRVETAGTHYLALQRVSGDPSGVAGQVVDYTATLSASQSPTLNLGEAVTGMLDGVNTFDSTYRLNGEAGQRVRITLQSLNATYGPGMDITVPSAGEEPARGLMNVYSGEESVISYEVTLPVSGVYLVRVYNGYYSVEGPVSGEFSLLVEAAQ